MVRIQKNHNGTISCGSFGFVVPNSFFFFWFVFVLLHSSCPKQQYVQVLAFLTTSVNNKQHDPPRFIWQRRDTPTTRQQFSFPTVSDTNTPRLVEEEKENDDFNIEVFDNVFPKDICQELHELAVDHHLRNHDGSSIFELEYASSSSSVSVSNKEGETNKKNTQPPHRTPLEWALSSLLLELEDLDTKDNNEDANNNNSQKKKFVTVEYWSRDTYMNLDAHADIDERELEDDGTIRCPQWGHVLYLQKQNKDSPSPTCIFANQCHGWNPNDDDKDAVDLIVVPSVPGRIVRFPGNRIHAVPKPIHRWFLTDSEIKKLQQQEQDEFFNEDNEDTQQRSVILFNIWVDDPPRGVKRDYSTERIPEGIQIDDDDEADSSLSTEEQRIKDWEEDYGYQAKSLYCNSNSQWSKAMIRDGTRSSSCCIPSVVTEENSTDEDDTKEEYYRCHVSLMGNKKRRLYPKKRVPLQGKNSSSSSSLNILRSSLEQNEIPTHIQLFHEV